MFHQPYGFAIREPKPFWWFYRSRKKTIVRYGSTDQEPNLPSIILLVKTCSSTALRSYPSVYPGRLGSLILTNQFNCGRMIFYLSFRPSRRYIFPAKLLVPTGTAFTACPAYRFPVIPGRLNFPRWCQLSSSRCGSNLSFAGILLFDFYSGGVGFVHPRLYPHPYPTGTRPYPHRPITAACLSANHNGPFMS